MQRAFTKTFTVNGLTLPMCLSSVHLAIPMDFLFAYGTCPKEEEPVAKTIVELILEVRMQKHRRSIFFWSTVTMDRTISKLNESETL